MTALRTYDTLERIMAGTGVCRGDLVLPILTFGFHAGAVDAETLFGVRP